MTTVRETIRQVRGEDASAFQALRLQALREVPTAFASSVEEEAGRSLEMVRERLETAPDAVFAAFDGAAMIGTAGFHAQSGPKRRHRGLLWGVFVAGGYRGGGVARALVERVIEHAAQHVLILEAGVTSGNKSAASLYATLGFETIGTLRKALLVDGVFHDEILLALDLTTRR
ncbi:N-acetyltransferase [Kaistia sp. 32K]|uniref:GNAT family N-acetyltransferase n=1 Tax=Kaistia sp. 32K TaxID=2795690 RepID=UPI0019159F20|nr:GNAT family N-acetyltransferase [Kaistia sp. 32K]BCP54966.1 N-acetyltransferase [Kaistia sp. 32K]